MPLCLPFSLCVCMCVCNEESFYFEYARINRSLKSYSLKETTLNDNSNKYKRSYYAVNGHDSKCKSSSSSSSLPLLSSSSSYTTRLERHKYWFVYEMGSASLYCCCCCSNYFTIGANSNRIVRIVHCALILSAAVPSTHRHTHTHQHTGEGSKMILIITYASWSDSSAKTLLINKYWMFIQ